MNKSRSQKIVIRTLLLIVVAISIFTFSACDFFQSVENAENGANDDIVLTDDFVTLTIQCSNILKNWEQLDEGVKDANVVPKDGYILKKQKFQIAKNETAYSLIVRVKKQLKIDMNITYSPQFQNYYIVSINHIAEKQCGSSSGWMYLVNGAFVNVGIGECRLKNADDVLLTYTCNGGFDVYER